MLRYTEYVAEDRQLYHINLYFKLMTYKLTYKIQFIKYILVSVTLISILNKTLVRLEEEIMVKMCY